VPSFGRSAIVATIISLTIVGCAASGPALQDDGRKPLGPSLRLLTERDLAPFGFMSLMDVLKRYRPGMLRFRDRDPLVYIDGRPASWHELEAVLASSVTRVQLLSPVEAPFVLGPLLGGSEPVLEVRLRPGSKGSNSSP
jgi:hypothetical protein